MVLLITYDLNKEPKDYNKLFKAIMELGSTHRDPDLDSVWFVSTNHTIQQTYDHVGAAMDKNDRLFIARLHSHEYVGWLSQNTVDWLKSKTH